MRNRGARQRTALVSGASQASRWDSHRNKYPVKTVKMFLQEAVLEY